MDKSTQKNILRACATMAGAAALLCALWLADISPTQYLETPQGISATTVSGIMMTMCALLTGWGGTIHFRCSDREIRKRLMIICALMVLWLIASLLKYAAKTSFFITMMWYLFYAPMLFVPTQFLFCVLHASTHGSSIHIQKAKRIITVITSVLLAFVLTNNLHFAVFQFNYATFTNESAYSYQWGYFVVLAWSLILMISSFIIIGLNARHNLIPSLVLIICVFALLMTYSVLYINRFDPVFSSNITMNYTLFIFIIAELCLRLKILPTCSSFRQLFQKMPVDTKILDQSGNIVLQTETAQPLPNRVRKRFLDAPTAKQTFTSSDQPTKRFRSFPLNGGIAILTEDIAPIVKNQQSLEHLRRRLQRQNQMLQQDGAMKSQLYLQQRKRQLYNEIRATLSSTVEEIGSRIEKLPGRSTPEEAEARKRELLKIKMLVAYCKRKGSLILNKSDANPDFNRERIVLVTNETASDLRTAGIECAALVETRHNLPAETVSILYDCFYDFCMASFDYENPAIMFFLHDKADSPNIAEMRLALDSDSQREPANREALKKLEDTLAHHNVAYHLASDGGSLSLTVLAQKNTLPLHTGGEND